MNLAYFFLHSEAVTYNVLAWPYLRPITVGEFIFHFTLSYVVIAEVQMDKTASCKTYILLTKHEGRTGRSARGLESTERPQRGLHKNRPRADIGPVGPRVSLVHERFIHD